MQKMMPTINEAATIPATTQTPARTPGLCIPVLDVSCWPLLKLGLATTWVIVVTTPLGSVETLMTVINGGVVVNVAPLEPVEVKTSGSENVVSGCVVTVLVFRAIGA
jgi:hypothetical protein